MGIDEKILTEILKISSSRCWSVDTYNPVPGVILDSPSSHDYEKGFNSRLMLKDMLLAADLAEDAGINTKLADKAREVYSKLVSSGFGKKDFSIIYEVLFNKKI